MCTYSNVWLYSKHFDDLAQIALNSQACPNSSGHSNRQLAKLLPGGAHVNARGTFKDQPECTSLGSKAGVEPVVHQLPKGLAKDKGINNNHVPTGRAEPQLPQHQPAPSSEAAQTPCSTPKGSPQSSRRGAAICWRAAAPARRLPKHNIATLWLWSHQTKTRLTVASAGARPPGIHPRKEHQAEDG